MAIDGRFSDVPRRFLVISFRKHLSRKVVRHSELLEYEYLNAFIHVHRILKNAREANAVYVHSCYFVIRCLAIYFLFKNVITDLHGLVPEESKMRELGAEALIYSWVERLAVRRSATLIFVTDAMRDYFMHKYPGIKARLFTVPIFSDLPPAPPSAKRDLRKAIYSGGLQTWQCVEEILDIVSRVDGKKWNFLFLTPQVDELSRACLERSISNVEIRSAGRSELPLEYATASFGFILREHSIVNIAACPTKLIEYLHFGVIPIVSEISIGDFKASGYQYIAAQDFAVGRLPSSEDQEAMRRANRDVADLLAHKSRTELLRLRNLILREEPTTSAVRA
jgi:hypothetical protein